MRNLLIILLCTSFTAMAQSFTYPKLPHKGKGLNDLNLQNWNIIDTAIGDLNNDKTDDLAFILQYTREVKEKRAYGDNETEIITEFQRPRILAIYFKDPVLSAYTLAEQNNNFILREQEGGAFGDPFVDLTIKENKLNLAFAGGSNWRWTLSYNFRYQNKQWILADAKNLYYNNGTGEMTEKNYDFTTNKEIEVSGNLHNRYRGNSFKESDLRIKRVPTFNNFKKPWTWEISPDNFL